MESGDMYTMSRLKEARRDIFEYIEVFYNREHLHSALGYMAPLEYEEIIAFK